MAGLRDRAAALLQLKKSFQSSESSERRRSGNNYTHPGWLRQPDPTLASATSSRISGCCLAYSRAVRHRRSDRDARMAASRARGRLGVVALHARRHRVIRSGILLELGRRALAPGDHLCYIASASARCSAPT